MMNEEECQHSPVFFVYRVMISAGAMQRAERLVQSGVDDGVSLLLDGRGVKVPGYNGNFFGPTIMDGELFAYVQAIRS